MNVIAIDTETFLIEPGLLAPPLVCVSFCTVGDDGTMNPPGLLDRDDGLVFVENLLLKSVAEHGDDAPHLAIHNAAFDMAVFVAERPHLLPLVFRAYDEGRIHCTKVRDQMLLNARGEMKSDEEGQKTSFTLADLVKRRYGVDISDSKDDPNGWRLRYSELDGVPLNEWPEEAKDYAKNDAAWHLAVYLHQEQERAATMQQAEYLAEWDGNPLADEPGQNRAAFALHLMSMYGVTTDAEAVGALEAHLTEVVEVANDKLRASGILKGKSTKKKATGLIEVTWSKDTKLIQSLVDATFHARGEAAPRTESSTKFPDGQVKMDEETLRAAGHADLLVLAENLWYQKTLSTWCQNLKGLFKNKSGGGYTMKGLTLPGRGWLLNHRYETIVSSGRTSAYQPNTQNPDRQSGFMVELRPGEWLYVPSIRECFVPRPGYWYLSVDYSFIELCTWAQTCLDLLGFSKLAEAIKSGMDPHVDMGVEILRAEMPVKMLEYTDKNRGPLSCASNEVDYAFVNAARKAGATWAKDARQLAKAANFGLPGGLGAATFVAYAKATYGVDISEQRARELKTIWRGKWTEADAYFNYVSNLQGEAFGQEFTVTLPRTGFVRGGCTFTAGCNTYFQGLAARGAKEAMWLLASEVYVGYSRLWTREEHGDTKSPLFGCPEVLFLHDEFISEVPSDSARANAANQRKKVVMVEGMRMFVPDVPIAVEETLMKRWYKEAEPVYVDGRLVPWEPKAPAKAA